MKKLVVSILVCLPTFASAAKVDPKQHQQYCEQLYLTAKIFMDFRQDGLPVIDAMKISDDAYDKVKDKYAHEILQKIILDAYEQPQFGTLEYKQNESKEFANKYYLGCMAMYK